MRCSPGRGERYGPSDTRWNTSLFHERNHGADFGRVLARFEVPDSELSEFERFLVDLGYDHVHEDRNATYSFFLR